MAFRESPNHVLNTNWSATVGEPPLIAYHNRAGGFSFADGHSEIKKWQDHRTTPSKVTQLNIASPNNRDMFWLQERSTRRYQ